MEKNELVTRQVREALAEDVGSGDITAQLLEATARLETELLLREAAVVCGSDWFDEALRQCDAAIVSEWRVQDGDRVDADTVICTVSGPARGILTAERTALNFLQTLSGTATVTRRYADLIAHTGCRMLDTRKTIPLLRQAQKYAVRCGGGTNHRIGLFDAFLIKENHLAASGGIAATIARARELYPDRLLEVEVEDLDQLQQAIEGAADRVLLDNFSVAQMREAVALNRQRVELEASGDIGEHNLVEIAETGVDFISSGALTKHLRAVDFSLRYR